MSMNIKMQIPVWVWLFSWGVVFLLILFPQMPELLQAVMGAFSLTVLMFNLVILPKDK